MKSLLTAIAADSRLESHAGAYWLPPPATFVQSSVLGPIWHTAASPPDTAALIPAGARARSTGDHCDWPRANLLKKYAGSSG